MATPRDFYVPIDMHGLEILNHRLHNLATDPTSPNDGDIWYNTASGEPKVRATRGSTGANRALIADDDDFHNRLSAETTANDADEILVWDASRSAVDHQDQYVRMTRANFVSGLGAVSNAYYRVTVDSGTTNLDASGEDAIILSGDGSILQTVGSTPGTNTVEWTWLDQTANLVFAGPSSGGAAAPTFRALVDDDMPTSYDPTNWDSAYTHSTVTTGNPHNVTMSDLGYSVVTTVGDPGSDSNLATEQAIREAIGSALSGGVTYKGGYNASTNTPDLESGTGVVTGDMYTVTVAGDFFTDTLAVGDVLIAENDAPTTLAEWTIVAREWDETFLELGDTPSAYTGAGGYMLMVNSTPDAVEFVDPSTYNLSNFNNDLYTFDSGLTESSGNVDLGGALTSNAYIETGDNTNHFRLRTYATVGTTSAQLRTDSGAINFFSWPTSNYTGTSYSFFQVNGSSAQMGYNDAGTNKYITITASTMSVFDASDTIGLQYGADYSTNGRTVAFNRWIPDWAAVISQIADQDINSIVGSPGAGQDGYAIVWDNSNTEYTLDAFASGATSFLGLSDTPSSYTGAANKMVLVNSTPDALIFSSMADLTTITDIADTDLLMVELAAGGLRDITWSSLKTEMWEDHTLGDHSEVTITSADDNHLLVYDTSGTTVVNKKAKHAETINGDDVTTDFTVTHNLGTEDIVVQVWAETGDDVVTPSITKTSANETTQVDIGFSTAPATGTNYRVIVYGWEG